MGCSRVGVHSVGAHADPNVPDVYGDPEDVDGDPGDIHDVPVHVHEVHLPLPAETPPWREPAARCSPGYWGL